MVASSSRSRQAGERGQLILIAAIIVAAAVLGGVVLLNTVHSSPDVSAKTDAQSVDDSDRVSQQIKSDLHDQFMAIDGGPGQGLPVVESNLEAAVDAYSDEYTELLSTNKSAVVDVELEDRDSGVAGYDDDPTSPIIESDDAWIIREADSIPVMSLEMTEIEPAEELTLTINDTEDLPDVDSIDIDSESVEYGGQTCDISDQPISIELYFGIGEVNTHDEYCSLETVPLEDPDDSFDVHFDVQGTPDGAFAVSGSDADEAESDIEFADGMVNAEYRLTYQDPNTAFETEFTLFERGGR